MLMFASEESLNRGSSFLIWRKALDLLTDELIVCAFWEVMDKLAKKDDYKNREEIMAALAISLTCKENIEKINEKWRQILNDKT